MLQPEIFMLSEQCNVYGYDMIIHKSIQLVMKYFQAIFFLCCFLLFIMSYWRAQFDNHLKNTVI